MQRLAIVVFYGCVALSLFFAITPVPQPIAQEATDKVFHMLAFAAMATTGRFAYPKTSPLRFGLYLSMLGAGIEIMQMIPVLHRDAEFMDWAADTAAAFFVIAAIQEGLAIFRNLPGGRISN